MTIINEEALTRCIRDAVRTELLEHFKKGGSQPLPDDERLLSKQELATELGVSLVTLTDWMKKGLPFLRLHKRVYFKKSQVLAVMQQKVNDTEDKKNASKRINH